MQKILVSLILVLPLFTVQPQEELTEVQVFLPFIPNIQFAPIYVAMEKGYFEEAGLTLTLEYGSEPDGLERLATGDIDYAIVGGEQVIVARANGRPVVYVYEWYQRNPIAVAVATTDEDTEAITAPDQLTGRTIGIPGRFGATYSSFIALLQAAELTENDVTLEEIGFNAPDVICVGGVQAAAVYVNNEPLQIRNRALAADCGSVTGVDVIPVADYADLVSNGLAINETQAEENPDQVEAFVEAFERGMLDTINNPLEAYALSASAIENLPLENEIIFNDLAESTDIFLANEPTAQDIADRRDFIIAQTRTLLNPDELLQLEVLLETIKLWDSPQPGLTEPESWQVTQDALLAIGFIEEPLTLEDAYTNDFIPGTQR